MRRCLRARIDLVEEAREGEGAVPGEGECLARAGDKLGWWYIVESGCMAQAKTLLTALVPIMNLHSTVVIERFSRNILTEEETDCTATTTDHTANVGLVPKLLKRI